MKQLAHTITIIMLLFPDFSFGQSSVVTSVINKIEFKEDTIKSVYDWVTSNISYDVNKLDEIKKSPRARTKSKFKTKEERQNHLLVTVIKSKKGVCEDYALLFHSIVDQLGYESFVVSGYTKSPKGRINRGIGHAWNAVKVNDTWKLFDPTWGAGSVEDEKKFVKRYSAKWFDVDPQTLIKTHMPYDPIWQLSKQPLSYGNFENSTPAQDQLADYDFDSLVTAYFDSEEKAQYESELERSESLGDGISLVSKWRKRTKKKINLFGLKDQWGTLQEAEQLSLNAITLFNNFANAANKQFKGKNNSIEIAKQNLITAKEDLEYAIEIFENSNMESRHTNKQINLSLKQSSKLLAQINKGLKHIDSRSEN